MRASSHYHQSIQKQTGTKKRRGCSAHPVGQVVAVDARDVRDHVLRRVAPDALAAAREAVPVHLLEGVVMSQGLFSGVHQNNGCIKPKLDWFQTQTDRQTLKRPVVSLSSAQATVWMSMGCGSVAMSTMALGMKPWVGEYVWGGEEARHEA